MYHDLSWKGSAPERAAFGAVSARSSYNLRQVEPFSWANMQKSESNEEYSGLSLPSVSKLLLGLGVLYLLVNFWAFNAGYGPKGNSSKYGKRFPVVDENRRNTYKDFLPSSFVHEPSVLTAFGGGRNNMVPVSNNTGQLRYSVPL